MVQSVAVFLVLLVLSGPTRTGQAAATQEPAPKVETAHLTMTPSVKPVSGARVLLILDVAPKPKMHVYAPGQKDFIPISVTLTPASSFTAREPVFPKGETYVFPATKDTQLVYSRPFQITQDITLANATGPVTIKGSVRYQACDDQVCYIPKTVPVTWTVAH
jgi:DsbC/DsbD-like thiol-disulfide interchange protein